MGRCQVSIDAGRRGNDVVDRVSWRCDNAFIREEQRRGEGDGRDRDRGRRQACGGCRQSESIPARDVRSARQSEAARNGGSQSVWRPRCRHARARPPMRRARDGLRQLRHGARDAPHPGRVHRPSRCGVAVLRPLPARQPRRETRSRRVDHVGERHVRRHAVVDLRGRGRGRSDVARQGRDHGVVRSTRLCPAGHVSSRGGCGGE